MQSELFPRAAAAKALDTAQEIYEQAGLRVARNAEGLVADLARSGLIAVRVSSSRPSRFVAEMLPQGTRTTRLMQRDGFECFLLAAPEGFTGKRLLDVGARDLGDGHFEDTFAATGETKIDVPPARDAVVMRWHDVTPPAAAPSHVLQMLGQSEDVSSLVGAWIKANYDEVGVIGKLVGEAGVSSAELYESLLATNGLGSDQISEKSMQTAITAAGWVTRKRTEGGIRYLLKKKPGAPVKMPGRAQHEVSSLDWAQFQAWRLSRETPRVLAARAEEARLRANAAEAERIQRQRYGSPEKFKEIVAKGWLAHHRDREGQRQQACLADARDFIGLPIEKALPGWWFDEKGDPVDYNKRVARFVRGEQ